MGVPLSGIGVAHQRTLSQAIVAAASTVQTVSAVDLAAVNNWNMKKREPENINRPC
jgi:3-keto-L-gulonate-6-phosphate decarboxylase